MKRFRWLIISGILFLAISAMLYLAEIVIFHDPHSTFFYFFQDLAFVPIQVLLVTLIIHRLLNQREKRSRLEKLNMVIGAFFSEVGRDLLSFFSQGDPELETIRKDLLVTNSWSDRKFDEMSGRLRKYDYGIGIHRIDLASLRAFLLARRDFLLRLLENPNLLEHESFTELLWAVFHLVEELLFREDVKHLPDTDFAHIAVDIKRAYMLLVHEWLDYMKHLKENYPFLFSLAIRTNPFDQNASPIVRS